MKVTLDDGAYLPIRAHTYDAGLDLFAREATTVPPFGGFRVIGTGFHAAIPQHFCGLVKSRSGLMTRGIVTDGTIDYGYTGEIKVILFNHGSYSFDVKPGDKIAQLVIVPCCLPPLEVVDSLEPTARGDNGFGSTGR